MSGSVSAGCKGKNGKPRDHSSCAVLIRGRHKVAWGIETRGCQLRLPATTASCHCPTLGPALLLLLPVCTVSRYQPAIWLDLDPGIPLLGVVLVPQELEKFKFVLEYSLGELRAQLDPKDLELAEMRERVQVGPWGLLMLM